MDDLAARLADEHELAGAYTAALDRFLALGGEDFDARAASVLDDVGLGRRSDREVRTLSGGEAARAALAAILLSRFDVFLLDEPTNNLDFAGLARLERFLGGLRRRRRARLARPRLPRPHDQPRGRDRGRDAPGARVQRHVVGVRGGARSAHAPSTRPPTPTTSTRSAATRRCSTTGAARRTRWAASASWRVRPAVPTGGRRTPCAARSTRRATTWSGSTRSRSRGRRGGCRWSSRRRRPRARSPSSPGAVVEVGSFTLGPVDLELQFGDRLARRRARTAPARRR